MELVASILAELSNWATLLAMVAGLFFGIVIGALPGLGATMGVALILPFTFAMPPATGLLLLIACYCGSIYGGSISAILIGSPGTAASAATVLDGYPLAKKGMGAAALTLALYASVVGALFSGVVLLTAAPAVARFALNLSSPEFFLLAMLGLLVVAGVSGGSVVKGILMACLGLFITTIGADSITGVFRFTFGNVEVAAGLSFVPIIIGLFAIAEVLRQIEGGADTISSDKNTGSAIFRVRDTFRYSRTIFRSSVIGTAIGIVPGVGPTVSSYISYAQAKRKSKTPESYGKGNMDGVAASESSNNATTGATLIPLLTLGIPGDSVTAVLLGAFLIQGLTPGPTLFSSQPTLVYTLMVGFVIVNIMMIFAGKLSIRMFSKVSTVSLGWLLPMVLVLCLVGTYALNNSMFDVSVAILFGIIGFVLQKFDYPVTPLLIGVVLGPLAESELRRSLLMSGESFSIFFTRPFSLVLVFLIALVLVLPAFRSIKAKRLTTSKETTAIRD